MKFFNKKNPAAENPATPNPYLNARRDWNDHVGSVVSSRQTWQIIGILSLLIALAGVGGMIQIGSQSKFIPYIVEVDKLGQIQAAGAVSATTRVDQRLIHATITDFIINARTVTPDVSLLRRAIFKVYALLAPEDPATIKMNEWLNGTPDSDPFKRAITEMVHIKIESAIPQTPQSWQVDWTETTRDRKGAVVGKPVLMRAVITVYTAEPKTSTTEEDIRQNPLGIYIRDYSWSPLSQ